MSDHDWVPPNRGNTFCCLRLYQHSVCTWTGADLPLSPPDCSQPPNWPQHPAKAMPSSPPSMFSRRPVWQLFAVLLVAATVRGEERNGWPFFVEQSPPDAAVESRQYVG